MSGTKRRVKKYDKPRQRRWIKRRRKQKERTEEKKEERELAEDH
jgi:hypothetical protein